MTASDDRVAPLTIRGAEPVLPPRLALMCAVTFPAPCATPVAVPTVFTVANEVLSEAHVALEEIT